MCYITQFTCIITCITWVTLHNLHVFHYMHYMHAIVNLWDRIWIFTRADWDIVIKCYQQAHSHEGQVLRLSCHFLFYSLCCRASCESPCNGVQHLVICTISFDFQDIANVLSNSWHSPSRAGILPALTCQSLTTCGSRQCFSSLSQSHNLTISHLHQVSHLVAHCASNNNAAFSSVKCSILYSVCPADYVWHFNIFLI